MIIGASGGCGLSACQLAAALGASEVVGVCSAANHSLAESQGATRCVDYNDQSAMDELVSEAGALSSVLFFLDGNLGGRGGEAVLDRNQTERVFRGSVSHVFING